MTNEKNEPPQGVEPCSPDYRSGASPKMLERHKWSPEEDDLLITLTKAGAKVNDISEKLRKSCSAVKNRRRKLHIRKAARQQESRACASCGADFTVTCNRLKFCSRSCAATANNKRRQKKSGVGLRCMCGTQLISGRTYCSSKCFHGHRLATRAANNILSHKSAKRYLLLSNPRCALCSTGETWNGKPLVMVLDHIDGNADNNQLDNLRILCPNCDSQTPTFKNRNKGRGRYARRTRYHEGKSY